MLTSGEASSTAVAAASRTSSPTYARQLVRARIQPTEGLLGAVLLGDLAADRPLPDAELLRVHNALEVVIVEEMRRVIPGARR